MHASTYDGEEALDQAKGPSPLSARSRLGKPGQEKEEEAASDKRGVRVRRTEDTSGPAESSWSAEQEAKARRCCPMRKRNIPRPPGRWKGSLVIENDYGFI